MIVKKAGNKIFGAKFTNAEQKAIDMEVGRQLAGYMRDHENEIDAMMLWVLHTQFGFGIDRLKRLYTEFHKPLDEMIKHYELEGVDKGWLCQKKLKDYGIDLDEME